jgi:hypothetical protein
MQNDECRMKDERSALSPILHSAFSFCIDFMQYFLQQLINGLSVGSIYALIAVGYTMVYGVLQLINFAHGDVFMVGRWCRWSWRRGGCRRGCRGGSTASSFWGSSSPRW